MQIITFLAPVLGLLALPVLVGHAAAQRGTFSPHGNQRHDWRVIGGYLTALNRADLPRQPKPCRRVTAATVSIAP